MLLTDVLHVFRRVYGVQAGDKSYHFGGLFQILRPKPWRSSPSTGVVSTSASRREGREEA